MSFVLKPFADAKRFAFTKVPRWLALLFGGLLLLWTSLEDNTMLPVALLGGGLALLIVQHYGGRRLEGRAFTPRQTMFAAALLGVATGVVAALATTLLMLIKDGMHSHLFPDYPFGMIVDTLTRAPIWALAGLLGGIGLLLAWWAVRREA